MEGTFLAEIVDGDGLRAAAGRLGDSLATARTHLRLVFEKTGLRALDVISDDIVRQVFEKTGARRQAELVGLAATGLAARHDDV